MTQPVKGYRIGCSQIIIFNEELQLFGFITGYIYPTCDYCIKWAIASYINNINNITCTFIAIRETLATSDVVARPKL